jgi:hypothetical protein
MKIELDINQLVELAKKYQEGKTSYTYPFFDAFEELFPVEADYFKGRLYDEFNGADE